MQGNNFDSNYFELKPDEKKYFYFSLFFLFIALLFLGYFLIIDKNIYFFIGSIFSFILCFYIFINGLIFLFSKPQLIASEEGLEVNFFFHSMFIYWKDIKEITSTRKNFSNSSFFKKFLVSLKVDFFIIELKNESLYKYQDHSYINTRLLDNKIFISSDLLPCSLDKALEKFSSFPVTIRR